MIGIYKITSPSGRIYIGQSKTLEKRFLNYKYLNCKEQPKLYRSLNKYGPENHKFEIISLCYEEQLNEFERDFQDAYDVIGPNGLNCRLTDTTEKVGIMSEETKKKMSEGNIKYWLGKKFSEEYKIKLSNARKGKYKGENHPMFNKKHTQSTKELMRLRKFRKVINTETGEIFNSIQEASAALNIKYPTLMGYLNGFRTNKTSLEYYNKD